MFYTYLWLREDGSPYYVGKGSGNRAYTSDGHRVRKPSDECRIIVQEFETEEDAFFAEMFLIAAYGRKDDNTGCLANLTDGGENPPSAKGLKRSKEFCRQISERNKGRTPSEKVIKAVKDGNTRRFKEGWRFPPHTEEQNRKIALSKTGKSFSAEASKNHGAAMQKRAGRSLYSKCRGVSWRKGRKPEVNGRWIASIYVNKKNIWLGYFLSEELACLAVKEAREKYDLPPLG